MARRQISLSILLVALLASGPVRAEPGPDGVRAFLKQHCFECHGAKKQENDLRFDTLGTELTDKQALEAWQNILDQLNLGQMPPAEKPRPASRQLASVVDVLTGRLKEAYAMRKSTGAQTIVRRLTVSSFAIRCGICCTSKGILIFARTPWRSSRIASATGGPSGAATTRHVSFPPMRSRTVSTISEAAW